MGGKKVKLAFITYARARKASLKKRKIGILKKINELSILCGVDAFIVIYSPDEDNPTVWPSDAGVKQQLGRFKSMTEFDRLKKMMNQENFLRDKLAKMHGQLMKQEKKNEKDEINNLILQIHQGRRIDTLNHNEKALVNLFADDKLEEVENQIKHLQPCSAMTHSDDQLVSTKGGSNFKIDMGLPYGNVGETSAGTTLPQHLSFGSNVAAANYVSLAHGNLAGNTFVPFDDMGLQQHFDEHFGSCSVAVNLGMPPFGFLKGGLHSDV